MASLGGFNANNVEPSAPMAPIPQDKYLVMIIDSEKKAIKDNKGEMLKLVFQVIDGQYKNRKVMTHLCLWHNQSDQCREIAQQNLSAICHAVGVLTPNDDSDLRNIPLVIDVAVDDAGKYNEIKGYSKRIISAPKAQTPAADGGGQEEPAAWAQQ